MCVCRDLDIGLVFLCVIGIDGEIWCYYEVKIVFFWCNVMGIDCSFLGNLMFKYLVNNEIFLE